MISRNRTYIFFLKLLGVTAITVMLCLIPRDAEASHTAGFQYTVTQDGIEKEVVPIVNMENVEDFYNYSSSSANTGLELSNTSILFLFEDENGNVSLVMIHDAPNDGSGGKAVFNFEGVPTGTDFVVRDDPLGEEAILPTSTWQWNDDNTDGGALSGSLNEAFTITITPEFPDSGGLTPGKIDNWQFLTGDTSSDPVNLDLTMPVTIKARRLTTLPLISTTQTMSNLTGECLIGGELTPIHITVEGVRQSTGEIRVLEDFEGNFEGNFEATLDPNAVLTFIIKNESEEEVDRVNVPIEGTISGSFNTADNSFPTPEAVISGPSFAFDIDGDGVDDVETGPWTLEPKEGGTGTINQITFSDDPPFPELGSNILIDVTVDEVLTFQDLSCVLEGVGEPTTDNTLGLVLPLITTTETMSNFTGVCEIEGELTPLHITLEGIHRVTGEIIYFEDADGNFEATWEATFDPNNIVTFIIKDETGGEIDRVVVPIEGTTSGSFNTADNSFPVPEDFRSGPSFAFDIDGDGEDDIETGPWTLEPKEGGSSMINQIIFSIDPPFPEPGSSILIDVTVDVVLTFQDFECTLDGVEAPIINNSLGLVNIPVDIKPQSCPNPLNVKSKGVLPVAILGTDSFFVDQVDLSSVRLEGVAPLRSSFEDVSTPFEPMIGKEDCSLDCTDDGGDGILDLTLKFGTQEIVAALVEVTDGECRVLTLTAKQFDGIPIRGEDVIIIKKKGK